MKTEDILINLPLPIMSPRLLLRSPQIGDGIKINAAVLETFDKLQPIMPWAKSKPSVDDSEIFVRQAAANWILKNNEEPYLPIFIFDKNSHDFIGGTGFHHINWSVPCLEIGYWISNKYSGHGYMTEAVNAITRYAIQHLGVKRIEIRCDVTNERSRKIPEILNFHLEATLKSNRLNTMNGEISDTLLFVKHDLHGLPDIEVTWPTK